MVVLVAVLAPVFTKYIESSRRSTDVQNANAISEGVLADVADGKITPTNAATHVIAEVTDQTSGGTNVSAVAKAPTTKGSVYGKDLTFTYDYDPATNECAVYVTGHTDGYNLAIEGSEASDTGAQGYKNAD